MNNLRIAGGGVSKSMSRLSSGLRINTAADDPSGCVLGSNLRAKIGGMNMALLNLQDALSMVRASAGVAEQVEPMVQRIRDLCVRASNDASLTSADRQNIQSEIDELIDSINKVSQAHTFNTNRLNVNNESAQDLNTVLAGMTVTQTWVGPAPPPAPGDPVYDAFEARITGMVTQSIEKVFGMLGIAPDPASTLDIEFKQIDGNGSILAQGGGGVGAMKIIIDVDDFLDPDGAGPLTERVGYDPAIHSFTAEQVLAHEMTHAVFIGLGGGGGSVWGQEMLATFVSGEADRRIQGDEAGVLAAIGGGLTSGAGSSAEYAETALAGKFISDEHGTNGLRAVMQEVINGSDFEAAIETVFEEDYEDFAEFEAECDKWSTDYINSGKYKSIVEGGLAWTADLPSETRTNAWRIQAGADNSETDRYDVFTPWTAAGSMDYLPYVNVTTQESAEASLETMNRAVVCMSGARAEAGMQENLLIGDIVRIQDELIAHNKEKSLIYDADMADEITGFSRAQITQMSSAAVLSQANVHHQKAVDLLLNTVAG